MMEFILIRIFGIFGLMSGVLSFQFKNHKSIMLAKVFSEAAYCVQYTLLGAHTAALISVVSVVRNYLFRRQVQRHKSSVGLIAVFSAVVVVTCMISWDGYLSLLVLVAKLISTVSYGMSNPKHLRLITFPSCFLWITYNIIVGSWEAMIGDSLSAISILIAIYKFDIRKKTDRVVK